MGALTGRGHDEASVEIGGQEPGRDLGEVILGHPFVEHHDIRTPAHDRVHEAREILRISEHPDGCLGIEPSRERLRHRAVTIDDEDGDVIHVGSMAARPGANTVIGVRSVCRNCMQARVRARGAARAIPQTA